MLEQTVVSTFPISLIYMDYSIIIVTTHFSRKIITVQTMS